MSQGDFYEVMPAYLRFVKGVVDSDDLPLNVGRENVQDSRLLEVIKRKVRFLENHFVDCKARSQIYCYDTRTIQGRP